MTKKPTTNPKREAGIAMLKAGTATLQDVATLAGVSRQAAFQWIQPQHHKVPLFDWQAKRAAYLAKQWRKQLAKFSAVDTLR